jgi:hypothetical protein
LVLGLVVVTAVVFAAISYAALFWALHLARLSGAVDVRSLQARYAAEGGIDWAMQQLAHTPTWSSDAGTDLTLNGIGVDVIIPPCCPIPPCQSPCQPRTLQAKVSY